MRSRRDQDECSPHGRQRGPADRSCSPMNGVISIALESPDQPEVVALIDALDAHQMPLYPAQSHHGIDIAALRQPNVLFAVGRTPSGQAVACGAVVVAADHGELKRMFTAPAFRGRGIAGQLLARLEDEARARGCRRFVLETGRLQPEAIALYQRFGYRPCGPFGDYVDDPHSVFMAKNVA
jgi:putative acetyltransferase